MKTELTKQLERDIWSATCKQGTFGCFEVTIGFFGDQRVDYMTYDTKGIWRCYEIKISKSDFNSKAHNTFVGHFNYYVMTKELYEQVKNDIPKHIGVYIGGASYAATSYKKAKRQELSIDEQTLKDSLIRSLCREAEKIFQNSNPQYIAVLQRRIDALEKERNMYREKYWEAKRGGMRL
jgi:hypothetical protein